MQNFSIDKSAFTRLRSLRGRAASANMYCTTCTRQDRCQIIIVCLVLHSNYSSNQPQVKLKICMHFLLFLIVSAAEANRSIHRSSRLSDRQAPTAEFLRNKLFSLCCGQYSTGYLTEMLNKIPKKYKNIANGKHYISWGNLHSNRHHLSQVHLINIFCFLGTTNHTCGYTQAFTRPSAGF